jgi:hypothetical protein
MTRAFYFVCGLLALTLVLASKSVVPVQAPGSGAAALAEAAHRCPCRVRCHLGGNRRPRRLARGRRALSRRGALWRHARLLPGCSRTDAAPTPSG